MQADGSVKTIIQLQPHRVTLVDVNKNKNPKSPGPRVITTDPYMGEQQRKSILLGEWHSTLEAPKRAVPLKFDMMERSERRSSVKKASVILEHNPVGRWSDPFTIAWRGGWEADEGGTRWKNTLIWMKEQRGRLDEEKGTDPEKDGKTRFGT